MNLIERQLTAEAMQARGGSFAQALGLALQRADPENAARIEAAFPEMVGRYATMAWSAAAGEMTLAEARRTPLLEGDPWSAEALRVAGLAAEVEDVSRSVGVGVAIMGSATAAELEAEIKRLRAIFAAAERSGWR